MKSHRFSGIRVILTNFDRPIKPQDDFWVVIRWRIHNKHITSFQNHESASLGELGGRNYVDVSSPTSFGRLTHFRANSNRIFKSRNFILFINIFHHRFYHTFSFQNPDKLCGLTYVNCQFFIQFKSFISMKSEWRVRPINPSNKAISRQLSE